MSCLFLGVWWLCFLGETLQLLEDDSLYPDKELINVHLVYRVGHCVAIPTWDILLKSRRLNCISSSFFQFLWLSKSILSLQAPFQTTDHWNNQTTWLRTYLLAQVTKDVIAGWRVIELNSPQEFFFCLLKIATFVKTCMILRYFFLIICWHAIMKDYRTWEYKETKYLLNRVPA